jgi:hypothetical protein
LEHSANRRPRNSWGIIAFEETGKEREVMMLQTNQKSESIDWVTDDECKEEGKEECPAQKKETKTRV